MNKELFLLNKYVKGFVIDVGSGGKGYRHIFSGYKEYKTLDIDKKFQSDIIASAYNIPLGDESVNTIICTQVLEHLNEPQKAIVEFSRVLKKGGFAIISAPFFNELHEEPIDFFRYTKYGLKYLVEKNDFEIIKILGTGGFFSLIAQLKIRYLRERIKNNKVLLKILAFYSQVYGRVAIFLDKLDNSNAGNKFAIDWILVIKKI